MEIQVFGLKKNADTRKALRFFSERRIRTHFVDLADKELAPGELQRFAQRFGIESLLDRSSKRFADLGLQHTQLSPSRWEERMLAEPAILRLPLVRRLGQPAAVTVGLAEPTWKDWIVSDTNKT